MYRILRTIKKSNNCTWSHVQKSLYFKLWPLIGRCSSRVHHNRCYSLAPGLKARRHITVNLRTEINATKGMIKNVIHPGSELGSPDYRSDTLATRPLMKNALATWLIIALIVASFERNFHIFSASGLSH